MIKSDLVKTDFEKKLKHSGKTPTLEFEIQFGFPNQLVIGVDEVGRGCLAGPVVAAAAVLAPTALDPNAQLPLSPDTKLWGLIRDSKLLSEAEREMLDIFLRKELFVFAVAEVSPQEIDSINIHHASLLAMQRAIQSVEKQLIEKGKVFLQVLVDGKFKVLGFPCLPIVKGDQKSLSIASASILAKVYRDRLMQSLHSEFPLYNFKSHKGYPTPAHKESLKTFGVCEHHRKSFSPVAELLRVGSVHEESHGELSFQKGPTIHSRSSLLS